MHDLGRSTRGFDDPHLGSAPSSSQWASDIGYARWGNGELETCTSSRANSFLDGHGDLVNRVTKSTGPIGHVTYGSTRLVTREKFNQAQGHWEGRIMVTPEAGVWPAWWALGTSKPWAAGGEIDFFEDSGTTGWHAAAHCPAASINSTCSPWTASFTSTAPTGRSARSRSPSTARLMTIDRIHVPDWPFGPGEPFCMIINIAVTSIPQRAAPLAPSSMSKWSSTTFMSGIR